MVEIITSISGLLASLGLISLASTIYDLLKKSNQKVCFVITKSDGIKTEIKLDTSKEESILNFINEVEKIDQTSLGELHLGMESKIG